MFDTMTMTKAVGAFCGALLIFLLGNWAATSFYSLGGEHEGEGVKAYSIAGDEGESPDGAKAEDTAAPADDFATLFAAADPEKGAKVFSKCKACHKIDEGVNATGPSLYGVVGRPVGSMEGFKYSDAIANLGGNWEPERMNEFLAGPKAYAPGTKMTFSGLKKAADRANLIAYLASIPK